MRRLLLALCLMPAFFIALPLLTAEDAVDFAMAKLMKRYASVVVGVNIVRTITDGNHSWTQVEWTPGVKIGDGDVLVSADYIDVSNNVASKYTMQQGKARARCEFKSLNERANIALLRPSVSATGGVSFASDVDLSVGVRAYAISVLSPETGFMPEIIPFNITANLELPAGQYFVTDLIPPGDGPNLIGCPAFDEEGKVLGIINCLPSDMTGTMLLVPNSTLRRAISKAINPRDASLKRCWFGAFTRQITPDWLEKLNLPNDLTGSLIEDVVKGSPASTAGIQSLDVVLEINGVPIVGQDAGNLDFYLMLNFRPNEEIVLTVYRGGERIKVNVKLLESPITIKDAESYNDDKIGVEVRTLTTDARIELGVEIDSPGVLVYNSVARKSFQVGLQKTLGASFNTSWGLVVVSVNGVELKTASDFKKQMEAGRARNDKTATLFVRFNKRGEQGCINTSFVRVEFAE